MHILLIEDDPDIYTLLQFLIHREGHTLSWAETAQEGIALFEEQLPDLVIFDLGLPDIDGQFIGAVFKQKAPQVPLIVLTGRDNEIDRSFALASGASAYLTKPFDSESLLEAIRKCLPPSHTL